MDMRLLGGESSWMIHGLDNGAVGLYQDMALAVPPDRSSRRALAPELGIAQGLKPHFKSAAVGTTEVVP
jgi:hypothetical protein